MPLTDYHKQVIDNDYYFPKLVGLFYSSAEIKSKVDCYIKRHLKIILPYDVFDEAYKYTIKLYGESIGLVQDSSSSSSSSSSTPSMTVSPLTTIVTCNFYGYPHAAVSFELSVQQLSLLNASYVMNLLYNVEHPGCQKPNNKIRQPRHITYGDLMGKNALKKWPGNTSGCAQTHVHIGSDTGARALFGYEVQQYDTPNQNIIKKIDIYIGEAGSA